MPCSHALFLEQVYRFYYVDNILLWKNRPQVKPHSEDDKDLDKSTDHSWVLCGLSGISEKKTYVP